MHAYIHIRVPWTHSFITKTQTRTKHFDIPCLCNARWASGAHIIGLHSSLGTLTEKIDVMFYDAYASAFRHVAWDHMLNSKSLLIRDCCCIVHTTLGNGFGHAFRLRCQYLAKVEWCPRFACILVRDERWFIHWAESVWSNFKACFADPDLVCVCVCIYIYIYIYINTCIHIHTYIH